MNIGNVKRFFTVAAAGTLMLASAAAFSACNLTMVKEEGYSEQEYRITSDFSQLRIDGEGGMNLTLSYGDAYAVSYSESDQEKFTFTEKDGKLTVVQKRLINGTLMDYKRKELTITIPKNVPINSLDVSVDGRLDCKITGDYGTVSFDVDGGMTPDLYLMASSVAFDVDGGVKGKMYVEAETVSFDCDGTFDVQMAGAATNLIMNCDGLATLKSKEFTTDNARFDCGGSLKFEITCNVSLSVNCAGACEAAYYGNPSVEKKISGVDKLTKGE